MNHESGIVNDLRLMQLVREGDPAAFTTLYDRHSTLIFSIALKVLADREEASDVLQQVFLKVHRKAALYHPHKGNPVSWLAAMTRNQSLDRLRQIKSRRVLGERLANEACATTHSGYHVEKDGCYPDEVELLPGAMASLRPEEIHVLKLAYFGGLSQTEISIELAQPLGSIKARIRRALSKLRKSLRQIMTHGCLQPGAILSPAAVPG